MTEKYYLNDIAKVLKVHPRTILRAIAGKENTYWTPKYNPIIDLVDLAIAYNFDLKKFQKVLKGKDEILTIEEVLDQLEVLTGKRIKQRNFRLKKYPAFIRSTKTVRYLRSVIGSYYVDYYT